ncbi:MAG: hypothetical protein JO173_08580 [Gammaproteobacteria bacterium]|nr:hypothetical protein [Gammaproteobacteria bacterium]
MRELKLGDQLLALGLPSLCGAPEKRTIAPLADPGLELEDPPQLLAPADRSVCEQ